VARFARLIATGLGFAILGLVTSLVSTAKALFQFFLRLLSISETVGQ